MYAGERNFTQVMGESLTEVTFKHRLKGGTEVGQVKYYNGLSQVAISWTVKEGSKYSRQDWWLISSEGETVSLGLPSESWLR